ncbi:MAG: CoA transferase [Burkholderiaceae bacterium]|nr:CoA transferase [Burkholderiaceae bacterium]MCD8564545.1 CoA transferase [Burkholderiaceae bacterium]
MQPLSGVKILDFSTLLPGPMCTLLLAEAGADVIKVERPGMGDEMRSYEPKLGQDSVNFALLNRGKRSLTANLKEPESIEKIKGLVKQADVLVEQFRPGVMQRLGLGFTDLLEINPRLIYCSITGWGQHGPLADMAAHDLNYQAQTGMLSLSADEQLRPIVPPTLTADIAGGTYPAVMNILLALRQRDIDNKGRHLDIAMADNLFTFMYWGLGSGWANNAWPRTGQELVTGGSPRYRIYRTKDNKFLAAAPLEDRFWATFLDIIGLPEFKDADPMASITEKIAARIEQEPLAYWLEKLANQDVCVNEIKTLEQAIHDEHFIARKVFSKNVTTPDGNTISALPVPVCQQFCDQSPSKQSPALETTDVQWLA